MTINAPYTPPQSFGNGVTTSFPFSYVFFDEGELVVNLYDTAAAADVAPQPVLNGAGTYDYTVVGVKDAATGEYIGGASVVFVTAPAANHQITISYDIDAVQPAVLTDNAKLPAKVIESGLDRLTLLVQQALDGVKRSLRAPFSNGSADMVLPRKSQLAGYLLGFDGAGLPLPSSFTTGAVQALVTAYSSAALPVLPAAAFALTLAAAQAFYAAPIVVPNGQAMLVSARVTIGDGYPGVFVHNSADTTTTFSQDGLGFVDDVGRRFFRVFSGPVDAKWFGAKGDGTGIAGSDTDYTTQLQAALTAAWTANFDCLLPAGVYKTTGLTLPGNAAGRTKAFRMYGQGSGEIFARGFTGGTILYSVTNAPVLIYTPDVANTGGGNIEIDHIRFEGNSATPVVHLKSLYAQSSFHHNSIFQTGAGNGLQTELSNTVEIHNNYALNRDWNTIGLGASRVGVGFKIFQTIATGLTKLRDNTSRGFKDGYVIGDGSVAMYSTLLANNECSVVTNGITITVGVDKALLLHNYMEGGDGGRGILIQGNYCTVVDNLVFSGFAKAIDDVSLTNYGSYGAGNLLSAGSVAGTTLLDIGDGGFGKIYTRNTLVFPGSGGSLTNVIAIHLIGTDPRIYWDGNIFNPSNLWVGGGGTTRIADGTVSTGGTTGTGNYGLGSAMSKSGAVTAPALLRGMSNKAVDPAALGNGDIAAGVCTLGEFNVFKMTLTAPAVPITSFAAPNLPDKEFGIWVITNAGGPLFTNGALLQLAGSVNYTPGANGCFIEFKIFPGGIAIETNRTVY